MTLEAGLFGTSFQPYWDYAQKARVEVLQSASLI
jgi:hypothetical protein